MTRPHSLWGLAPAVLLSAASLALADDVSLVGDFRLRANLAGLSDSTLQIDDDLAVRWITAKGVQEGRLVRLSDARARLTLPGLPPTLLAPRPDGSFALSGGVEGTLRRQRTFPAADVERAKEFLQRNAKALDNLDCITTVNRAVRILFRDAEVRVGSQQDRTMNGLVAQGLAHPPQVIEFFDANGKKTLGVTEPKTLRESLWGALLTQTKGERGWSVFGLSIMDGHHSVLLFLDTNDAAQPRVYWADQWSSKGGWLEYDQAGLDGEIESRTNSWWSSSKKPRTRTTIWRLRPHALGHVQIARTRVRLNLRSTPDSSVSDNKVDLSQTTDRFQVVDREGKWRRLLDAAGQVVWGHGGYMLFARGVPAGRGLSLNAGPVTSVELQGMSGVLQN